MIDSDKVTLEKTGFLVNGLLLFTKYLLLSMVVPVHSRDLACY
jgi:hypothetical protein